MQGKNLSPLHRRQKCQWQRKIGCSGNLVPEREKRRSVRGKYEYCESARLIGLPVSRQFPVLDWRKQPGVCRVGDRLSLPMGYPL